MAVLDVLGDCYAATPKQIARLIRKHPPTKNDVRSVNATLKLMMHDASRDYVTRGTYKSSFLYGLTRSGAAYERIRGYDARDFQNRDYDHEYILTCVHIALVELCREKNYRLHWNRRLVDYKKLINPDAIATITTFEGSYTLCIEIERQHYGESHRKKAEKYKTIFDTEDAKQLFGSRKFRVLFFVETEKRQTTLLEKLAETHPYRMYFISTFDGINDIGGKIYKTPKDYEKVGYSFLQA